MTKDITFVISRICKFSPDAILWCSRFQGIIIWSNIKQKKREQYCLKLLYKYCLNPLQFQWNLSKAGLELDRWVIYLLNDSLSGTTIRVLDNAFQQAVKLD